MESIGFLSTLTLTGYVALDLPFFESKLLRKNCSVKNFKIKLMLANHLVSFSSQNVSLYKHHFLYALLGESQVIQKVGLIGQPQ